jgi:hypothetical protein
VCNNGEHLGHLLWSGGFCFVICRPIGLLILLAYKSWQPKQGGKKASLFRQGSSVMCDRLSDVRTAIGNVEHQICRQQIKLGCVLEKRLSYLNE